MLQHGFKNIFADEAGAGGDCSDSEASSCTTYCETPRACSRQEMRRRAEIETALFNHLDRARDGQYTKLEVRKLLTALDFPLELKNDLVGDLVEGQITSDQLMHVIGNFMRAHPKYNDKNCPSSELMTPELRQIQKSVQNWNRTLGIGVAGNVAAHLAQAGEGKTEEGQKDPSALFCYYVPQLKSCRQAHENPKLSPELRDRLQRLERFPTTNFVIQHPGFLPGVSKVQVEPEVAIKARICYRDMTAEEAEQMGYKSAIGRKMVSKLVPKKIAAFNDCSIRSKEGSKKLSERKNWGYGSKGISVEKWELPENVRFDDSDDHVHARLVLASYAKRENVIHAYTKEASVKDYMSFFERLLEWIVERMNAQQTVGNWENIHEILDASEYPEYAWLPCGAGEYTTWGAENYIQPGDETAIILYDEKLYPEGLDDETIEKVFHEQGIGIDGMACLHQVFVNPSGFASKKDPCAGVKILEDGCVSPGRK